MLTCTSASTVPVFDANIICLSSLVNTYCTHETIIKFINEAQIIGRLTPADEQDAAVVVLNLYFSQADPVDCLSIVVTKIRRKQI